MTKKSKNPSPSLPAPKLTKAGMWALCLRVVLPFIGVLLMLDILFYLILRFAFGRCYGVMCWF